MVRVKLFSIAQKDLQATAAPAVKITQINQNKTKSARQKKIIKQEKVLLKRVVVHQNQT